MARNDGSSRSYTVGQLVLAHLWRSRDLPGNEWDVPYSYTQDGISMSLGISRAHASIELKKLIQKDLVKSDLKHVVNGTVRRKVYFLTKEGEEEAKRIERISEKSTDKLEGHMMNREVYLEMHQIPELGTVVKNLESAMFMVTNMGDDKWKVYSLLSLLIDTVKLLAKQTTGASRKVKR